MAQAEQNIEDLDRRATKFERVAQSASNYQMWLRNELEAAELRRRIEVLKRVAKLPNVHSESTLGFTTTRTREPR